MIAAMKRFFACFACALLGCAPSFAQPPDEALAQIKEADVHALLRETAVKVEEKFKRVHAEADGLTQLVEEILTAPEPPKAAGGDRNQQRAAEMSLLYINFAASAALASVRGFVFDDSSAGQKQRYQELETAAYNDAADVLRWLEMRHLAEKLDWEEKEKLCGERALGAARALVARDPKNAEAYALLAEALQWEDGAETLKALQKSLELDSKQLRALVLMLGRRMQKTLHSAALRRESGLDEKLPTSVYRLLYDTPLSEEEILTLGKRQDKLRHEAEALLDLAQEHGDLAVYLLTLQNMTQLRWHAQMAAHALKRGPDVSYEEFLEQVMQQGVMLNSTVLSDDEHLHDALRLAKDDPEAIGAIMLMALAGDAMAAIAAGKPPSLARIPLADEITGRLAETAGADTSLQAARASESACVIQMMMFMLGQRPPRAEMILRTIQLDPFRHRTLKMLLVLCVQKEDLRAARAVTQIQLALVPDLQARRMAAAAAAKTQDWPASHRLLDACLKEAPNNVPLLNQRAATLLKENQSKATQRKAAVLYDKIEKLMETDKAAQPAKNELEILARNGALFLAICGKSEEAESRLAAAIKAGMISERSAKEVEPWLR